jgi:hypothetical protein
MDLTEIGIYTLSSFIGGMTAWATSKFFNWIGEHTLKRTQKVIKKITQD